MCSIVQIYAGVWYTMQIADMWGCVFLCLVSGPVGVCGPVFAMWSCSGVWSIVQMCGGLWSCVCHVVLCLLCSPSCRYVGVCGPDNQLPWPGLSMALLSTTGSQRPDEKALSAPSPKHP